MDAGDLLQTVDNPRRLHAVIGRMQDDLGQGIVTARALKMVKRELLPSRYKAGRTTCELARRFVLQTLSEQPGRTGMRSGTW